MYTNLPLFDCLVQETSKVASVPVNQISINRDCLSRWDALAHFWNTHPDLFQNLFYKALFHIIRGTHSPSSATLKPLLTLVEKAILTDTTALCRWRRRKDFQTALGCVSRSVYTGSTSYRWKSAILKEFILCRKNHLIHFPLTPKPRSLRKDFINSPNDVPVQVESESHYSRFIELMALLVPNCNTWSEDQWLSEKHIFSQIKARHGIDYSLCPDEFDRMVVLYRNKQEEVPYHRNLFAINNLPLSIASLIWPKNKEADICAQFDIACNTEPHLLAERYSFFDPIAPQNMVKSWAFNQMEAWREARTYVLPDTVRNNMMHYVLGDHPLHIGQGITPYPL